jgi:hypothetical protein
MLLTGRELASIGDANNIAEVGRRVAKYIL